jgi:hypothetical protein
LLTLITRLILRPQPSIGLVSYRHGWGRRFERTSARRP